MLNEGPGREVQMAGHKSMAHRSPEVVVITGASAGLGRALARAFGKEGAHIALIARGREGLEGARRDVESLGGKAIVISTDVSDAEAIEQAAVTVEREFGAIDIWINNAMVSVFSPVKEMRPEEYKRVTEVTYLGVVYGTLAALRRMLPRDRGVIVQVGSALAYRGIPLQSAYCAAKHAIQGFHDSLRSELIHDKSNVRVTMVQLPAMNTPQFSWVKSRLPRKPQPVPPIYQPEIGAEAVLFAARNDRRELYVGYPTVEAIVGDKIAPSLGDWYLARNGYESQQTSEPTEADRRDNLWEPIPGDHDAHGTFGDRAISFSSQLWLTKNRNWLAMAAAGLAGVVIATLLKRKFSGGEIQNGQHQFLL
jgi:NAD(P)-dependent dehydrogenase (short-subunit alcohol dehydrogenase family)